MNIGNLPMTFDMEKMIKRPLIDNQTFFVDHVPWLAEKSFADICSDDNLEKALTTSVNDILSTDSRVDEYARLLDACDEVMNVDTAEDDSTSIDVDRYLQSTVDRRPLALDNWSSEKAPRVELKQLPAGLKYAFLNDKLYPVIVKTNLSCGEFGLLLNKICKYWKAIGYSLDDIPGISPDLCMHRIHLEDCSKSSIEHQRRLNPNLKEVVKKEIIKLLDA